MSEEDNILEKIYNGISSYLKFIKYFKQVKNDDVIISKKNDNANSKFSYVIRQYNLECYIIDKIFFDEFRKSINFNELIKILNDINEETKKKFKEELKKHLVKNPYKPNSQLIKFYSKEEEIKEIVKNFNSYSIVNKEILCDAMDVPISKLEGKMFRASKNGNNTSLLSVSNNFTLTINIEKIKQENKTINAKKENIKEIKDIKDNTIKEYKNLYYVEEITKKIFVLLYFFERNIRNKIKRDIKDVYNFKKYYLINNEWMNKYKEFFMYDFIKKKLDSEYKDLDYSYKKIKNSLDNVVRDKIGQIRLYNETKLPQFIRDAENLECKNEKYSIYIIKDDNQQETLEHEQKENLYTPDDFFIIDEFTYNLLIKEEFFYNLDKIGNKISFDVLLGINQIFIKNKIDKENNEKYKYSKDYLVFSDKHIEENGNEGKDINEKYNLEYILNFGKDDYFYNSLGNIIKEGLENFITNKNLDVNEANLEQNIKDEKQNILGKFINIRLNEEVIKKLSIKNNQIEEQKIENKDDNNYIKIKNNEEMNYKDNYNKIIDNNIIGNNNIYINNSNNNNNNKYNINYIDNNNIINNKEILIKDENEKHNNSTKRDNNGKIKKSKTVINNNKISNKNKESNIHINKILDKSDSMLDNFLNLIFEQIVDDITIENLEIENLVPNEINTQLENNNQFLTEIIIMSEESNKNFSDLVQLTKNKIRDKDNILQFDFVLEPIKKRIDNKFVSSLKIIENYKDYKNKNKNNKKFYVLTKKKFFKLCKNNKHEKVKFYHFKYKNNSYIFFEKEKKIIKIEKDENFEKNALLILKDIEDKKVKDFLRNINTHIKKNKNITEFNKNINECYLINNKWLKQRLEFEENQDKDNTINKITETIQPEMKDAGYLNFKNPINFGIIFKNDDNIPVNELFISLEDFYSSKIFVVNWQNIFPKNYTKKKANNSFIGIIDKSEKTIIYFYSINDKEYIFEFLIKFDSEDIAKIEIEKILKKGIGLYLDENDINNQSVSKNLNDNDLKSVGLYINFQGNDQNNDILKPEYTKIIKENKISYLNGILQCLANIELLKKYFMNRELLKGIFDEDTIISKYFYKIIQYMWSLDNEEEKNNIYEEFKSKISELSPKENILDNPKLLIEFLLLKMHNELKTDIKNNKNNKNEILKLDTIYSGRESIQEEFYKLNNSKIQELFFFETEKNSFDDNNKKFAINCTLDFNLGNILNKKKKEKITISKFLEDFNKDDQRKISSCPKILIIIINHEEDKNIHFEIEEEINIINYVSKSNKNNTKYQLISFIENNSKTFCKSHVNNKWYKYKKGNQVEKGDIKQKNKIPYLLIYKESS